MKGKNTNYIISSHGILYRINFKKYSIDFVRPYMEKDGHLRTTINVEGERYKKYIHQLVAEAFIPNPEKKEEIHHIDGDEINNEADNLMWVTHTEHVELTKAMNQYKGFSGSSNPSATSTDEQIEKVCMLLQQNELYPEEICAATGISYSQLQHIIHDENSWKYIKEKYDISKYNRYKRKFYTEKDKVKFRELRIEHPEYTLRVISEILDINYETLRKWNNQLKEIFK